MLPIFQSLIGMALIVLIGYALSAHRSQINWRAVGGAFAIQFTIGALVLYFPPGKQALEAVAGVVSSVLGYAQDGMDFLFGSFSRPDQRGFVFDDRPWMYLLEDIGRGSIDRITNPIGGGC